jgi:carbon storage regulator
MQRTSETRFHEGLWGVSVLCDPFYAPFTLSDSRSLRAIKEESGMLVLSRLVGEKIVVGENITIVVSRILPGRVVLGVQAPRNVVVMREELLTANSPQPRFPNQESEPSNAITDLQSLSAELQTAELLPAELQRAELQRAELSEAEAFTQELIIEFDDDTPSTNPSTPVATQNESPKGQRKSQTRRQPSKQTRSTQDPPVALPERTMPRQSLREFAQALLKAPANSKTNPSETSYETKHCTPTDTNTTGNQHEPLLPQDDATTSSYRNAHIISEPIERCA